MWAGATVVSIVLYFPGYGLNNNGCFPAAACSPRNPFITPSVQSGSTSHSSAMSSPGESPLVGSTIPCTTSLASRRSASPSLPRPSSFVSNRGAIEPRSSGYRSHFMLIAFSLLWDVTITLGRERGGILRSRQTNRYVMANLVLLTGIVMYALVRTYRPAACLQRIIARGRLRTAWLAPLALALFLVVQVTGATGFGLSSGREISMSLTEEARLIVNEDRLPPKDRLCENYVEFVDQAAWSTSKMRVASADQLGEFRPSSYRYYRDLGPPSLFPFCSKVVPTS